MDRSEASAEALPAPDEAGTLPISVVIPAYNRADLLPRAIASVRAQTAKPAEIIVVDDHSEDDTGLVAERLGARVIRHERNRGHGAARNSAIEAASQDWVALLDSDDEWTPDHLEHVYAMRDGHVLIGAATLARGDAPRKNRIYGVPGPASVLMSSPADAAYPVNRVPPSSALLRRETVLDAGGFDTSLKLCEDVDMWMRMLERGSGVASPRIGSFYYVHGGQASSDGAAMHRAYRDVLARYRGRTWWRPSLVRRYEGIIAWDAFRQGMAERRLRAAGAALMRIATHPDRLRGALEVLVWRSRTRRRSAELQRS